MRASDAPDYHAARLLVLLEAFTSRDESLDGLTKLAKLDFLLRYPVMLERLVERRRLAWPPMLEPTPAERQSVESRMVRHKYGPWDSRYYSVLGSLVARDLLVLGGDKTGLQMRLTEAGRETARRLASTDEWRTVSERSAFLRRHFNQTGNRLKSMIYEELPDVVDRPRRAVI